jgi:hypothetical protein
MGAEDDTVLAGMPVLAWTGESDIIIQSSSLDETSLGATRRCLVKLDVTVDDGKRSAFV